MNYPYIGKVQIFELSHPNIVNTDKSFLEIIFDPITAPKNPFRPAANGSEMIYKFDR